MKRQKALNIILLVIVVALILILDIDYGAITHPPGNQTPLILPGIDSWQPPEHYVTVAAADSERTFHSFANYICDGTNDEEEISAAIANLPSAGGAVILSSGTFNLSDTVRMRDSVTLKGEGENRTVLNFLTPNSISTAGAHDITLRDFQFVGKGRVYITSSRITLKHVRAYGLDNLTLSAFHIYATDNVIEDVQFIDCSAIDCNRSGFVHTGEGKNALIRNVRYVRCSAVNNGRFSQYYGKNGEYPDSWSSGFVAVENIPGENIYYEECLATGSWENGFHLEPPTSGGTAVNITYVRCTAADNGQKEWTQDPHAPASWGAGFMVVQGVSLQDCTAERNIVGYYCNYGGGNLAGCSDAGSKTGFLILKITRGLTLQQCATRNTTQPVRIWTGATRNVLITGMTMYSATNQAHPGITIERLAENPTLVRIVDSTITNYRIGVDNRASGRANVENVQVRGAITDFVNCKIVRD